MRNAHIATAKVTIMGNPMINNPTVRTNRNEAVDYINSQTRGIWCLWIVLKCCTLADAIQALASMLGAIISWAVGGSIRDRDFALMRAARASRRSATFNTRVPCVTGGTTDGTRQKIDDQQEGKDRSKHSK